MGGSSPSSSGKTTLVTELVGEEAIRVWRLYLVGGRAADLFGRPDPQTECFRLDGALARTAAR